VTLLDFDHDTALQAHADTLAALLVGTTTAFTALDGRQMLFRKNAQGTWDRQRIGDPIPRRYFTPEFYVWHDSDVQWVPADAVHGEHNGDGSWDRYRRTVID